MKEKVFVWHELYYSGIVFADSLEEAREKLERYNEDKNRIYVYPLLMKDEYGYYEFAARKGWDSKEQDLDIFIINDQ